MLAALPGEMRAFVEAGGRRARRFLASLRFLLFESSLRADVEAEPDFADEVLAEVALGFAHRSFGGTGILVLKTLIGLIVFGLALRIGMARLKSPWRPVAG